MASVTSKYYQAGTGGVTAVIGLDNVGNRVGRYAFTTPATGATGFTLSITDAALNNGGAHGTIRFYITTDGESHKNAGANTTPYTDEMVRTGKTLKAIANGQSLKPNTTYYIWVFPGFGYAHGMSWYKINGSVSIELTVRIGLVQIWDGSKWVPAIPHIYDGSKWVQAIPYVWDGSKWNICS